MTRYSEYDEIVDSIAYYDENLTVEVSVEWLMNRATSSCDTYELDTFEGWRMMLANKCADTGFGHLVESIMQRGFMPEGAIGFLDGEITEGHHRLCAAVLLCLDTVWISPGGGSVRVARPGGYPENLVSAHDNWSDPYSIYIAV